MAGTRAQQEYRRSGIRSVQSTPLRSRSGQPLGMLSTHWRAPHSPTEDDFRLFDVLARQAADAIECALAEDALRESEDRFRLIVQDSGVGFDPQAAIRGRGLGLTSMKERLELLGGRLSIHSALGRGTTIQAHVPLSSPTQSACA